MMNEQYWREFYSRPHTLEPSPFAVWARQFLYGKRVLDLGCGNGRDTNYLRCTNDAIGVDLFAPEGPQFRRQSIESYLEDVPKAEVFYCRFLFHAIGEELQRLILYTCRTAGAVIYIEVRSTLDTPNPDHERRLIDGQELLAWLQRNHFYILHYEEGHGLAEFGGENPHVIRIVASSAKNKEEQAAR